jgi:hypothetical protein
MFNNFTVLISIYKNNSIIEVINLIKSIKSQNFYPGEIIFIYDGPIRAEIDKIIKSLKNLKIIYNKKNIGLGASLRKGILAAKYGIIIRSDVDDISIPSRFKELVKAYTINKNVDLIGSLQKEIYNKKSYIKNLPYENEIIRKKLIYRNYINHPTVLLKKKKILQAGNYENVGRYLHCNNFEDYYLWLKMLKINAIFKNIPRVLVMSHINKNFYYRREGKKIISNYKIFLKKSYRNKILTKQQFYLNLVIRNLIYILPNKLFIIFFNYFLRKKYK